MVASREELNNNSEASLTFSIYTPVYSMSVQSPVQHHCSGAAETHAPFPCHDRTRASEGIYTFYLPQCKIFSTNTTHVQGKKS